jgi:DNA-binding GntR family transcriptional regulator
MREASVDDHVGIAQAIRDGNAEAAGTLMSLHIRSGRDLLIERMKYAGISSLTPN